MVRTDQFTVMGKEAGPVLASTRLVDFGGQNVNTGATAPRTVNLTNVGADPLTITALAATPAGRFNVQDPGTCIGRTLLRDNGCNITVTFDPVDVGQLAGSLTVTHSGIRSPFTIDLAGTGTNPGQEAVLSASPTSLSFGSVRIRTQSLAQRVRVTNTGTRPLVFSSIQLTDVLAGNPGDKDQFVVTSDACTGVAVQPTKRCDINVAVRPTGNGALAADLVLTANVSAGPTQIHLNALGTGGVAAVSGAIDAATGYPDWYQDETGLRIGECIDPADPNCIVLPDDNYDPSQPLSGRPSFSNFPTEFFYFVADSDIITTPGCATSNPPIPPGRAFVRSAEEAAFVGDPTDGGQMVFGRNRIVVRGGLCPNTSYTFTHPYGRTILTTDGQGSVKPAAGTTDLGCFPVAPDICDFSEALTSPISAGYLQWDPAVAPQAPAGYLGDAATLHRVTGAPFTAPGETAPANYFRIQGPRSVGGPSVTIGQTNLFSVMGKLNGPLVANPSNVAFQRYAVGGQSGSEQVTLTNQGTTALTITSLVLGGTNPGDFTPDGGCNNAFTGGTIVLNPGASCNFNVLFAPLATGFRTADITVNHTGRNTGFKVHLNGVGAAAQNSPAISISPGTLGFVDLHTGQRSASQSITVSNLGGQQPLEVGTPTVDSAQFALENGCTAPVAVDESCTIKVRFTPTVGGVSTGIISIPSNVPDSPLVTATATGRGFTGTAAQSATVRPFDGFAEWYQDDNGVRVEPCLQAADPNCIVLGDAGFDPGLPLEFPGNYPTEFFYQVTDSDIITTDGCGGLTAPGPAFLRLALEGTFATGAPEAGQQITFGRVRVVVRSGLCPNTSYSFTTPYGQVGPFLTNSLGGIAANVGTIDADPLVSPHLTSGLVRWDPAQAPAAPAGYLGDAITLHKIVGSRFTAVGDTEPANYFGIDGTSMRTELFTVSGRLAGPVTSTPEAIDFGNVNELTTSASSTVTLTNLSPDPITGFTPTLTGANPGDFQITGGSCAGGAIGLDQTCTVTVRFAPLAISTPSEAKTATLSIGHSGRNSPATATLSGTAINVALPAVTLNPTSVAFGSRDVGTVSAPTSITVTNSGTADLHVSTATLIGTNGNQFQLTSGCAAAVAPNGSCTLQVSFAPTSGGAKNAQIQLTDDAPTSPQLINLSGTGVSASLSLSPTSLAFGSIGVGGSSTKSVSISNTGTATLTISSLTISGSTTFTIASHNCGAGVAPGRNCSINLRFAPNARVAFSGQLNIASNASGVPIVVPLTGTGK